VGRADVRRQVPQWLSLLEFRSLVVSCDEAISAMAARARFTCGSGARDFHAAGTPSMRGSKE
jgi:hypothetical protein